MEEHSCAPAEGGGLPTRLIDVGSLGNEQLRLFVPFPGSSGRYAALTYCWGRSQHFVTTSLTLEDNQRGFHASSLPRTLRDAVRVTQKLGLRYLWVDALCIIQGDDHVALQDWTAEVIRMEDVYRNAFVTISAASSPHCDGGLFGPCTWTLASCTVTAAGDTKGTVRGRVKVSIDNGLMYFHREPINSRGWTLQESMLSPRLLIYTAFGAMWRCERGCQRSSAIPCHYFIDPYRSIDIRKPQVSKWSHIRENYCARGVTEPKDKLPALAALARNHHRVTGDQYLAGLWESCLLSELLWLYEEISDHSSPLAAGGRPPEYRAPSWSWASIDGTTRSLRAPIPSDEWEARIVQCHVELADPRDPFGQVTGGHLVISGPLAEIKRLEWMPSERKNRAYTTGRQSSKGGERDVPSIVWMDPPGDGSGHHTTTGKEAGFLLMIQRVPNALGLALRRVAGQPGTYTRFGLFRVLGGVVAEGFGSRGEVTII